MYCRYFNKIITTPILIAAFLCTSVVPVQAQDVFLPAPGVRLAQSPNYLPPMILGVTVDPTNPLKFNFIIDQGDDQAGNSQKQDYQRLIKYFLAGLAIPEKNLWVNLSPYEGNRIIESGFGQTEMGRDLLAQDYVLKQITSSLIYPEDELGRKFWEEVYMKSQEQFGTTNIPINTFNKVWIVPSVAEVYEKGVTAYVVKSHLKVMLEQDYLALEKHGQAGDAKAEPLSARSASEDGRGATAAGPASLASQIVREIVLPALEKEVNEGKNFANLRQINNALILATWYKQTLKESLLGKFYVDRSKVKGVDHADSKANEKIYQQYLIAFKKGAYNFIKEEQDPYSGKMIPRKYFSGGFVGEYSKVVKSGTPSASFKAMISQAMTSRRIYDAASVAQDANRDLPIVTPQNILQELRELNVEAINARLGRQNAWLERLNAADYQIATLIYTTKGNTANRYAEILLNGRPGAYFKIKSNPDAQNPLKDIILFVDGAPSYAMNANDDFKVLGFQWIKLNLEDADVRENAKSLEDALFELMNHVDYIISKADRPRPDSVTVKTFVKNKDAVLSILSELERKVKEKDGKDPLRMLFISLERAFVAKGGTNNQYELRNRIAVLSAYVEGFGGSAQANQPTWDEQKKSIALAKDGLNDLQNFLAYAAISREFIAIKIPGIRSLDNDQDVWALDPRVEVTIDDPVVLTPLKQFVDRVGSKDIGQIRNEARDHPDLLIRAFAATLLRDSIDVGLGNSVPGFGLAKVIDGYSEEQVAVIARFVEKLKGASTIRLVRLQRGPEGVGWAINPEMVLNNSRIQNKAGEMTGIFVDVRAKVEKLLDAKRRGLNDEFLTLKAEFDRMYRKNRVYFDSVRILSELLRQKSAREALNYIAATLEQPAIKELAEDLGIYASLKESQNEMTTEESSVLIFLTTLSHGFMWRDQSFDRLDVNNRFSNTFSHINLWENVADIDEQMLTSFLDEIDVYIQFFDYVKRSDSLAVADVVGMGFQDSMRVIDPDGWFKSPAMNSALVSVKTDRQGGVDLTRAEETLTIKRDGRGIPLPVQMQDAGVWTKMDGLTPIITGITQVKQLPGLTD